MAGSVALDDAPPGMAGVAQALSSARVPRQADELVGQAATVAAMTAAVSGSVAGTAAAVPAAGALRPGRSRRTAVGAGLAAAIAVGLVGVAAATTAVVRPWEPATSTTMVGVHKGDPTPGQGHGSTTVPKRDTDAGGDSGSERTTAGSTVPRSAVGPDPTAAAREGLCTAFGARTQAPDASVAAANLAGAATAAGQSVEQFCSTVDHPAGPATSVPAVAPGAHSAPPVTTQAGPRSGPTPVAPGQERNTAGSSAPPSTIPRTVPPSTVPNAPATSVAPVRAGGSRARP